MEASIVRPARSNRPPHSARTSRLAAIVLSLLFVPASATRAADDATAPAAAFVVRQARVFDGERTIPSTDVLVRDGRVAAIGPSLDVPADVAAVDGRDRTLLPGRIAVLQCSRARVDAD